MRSNIAKINRRRRAALVRAPGSCEITIMRLVVPLLFALISAACAAQAQSSHEPGAAQRIEACLSSALSEDREPQTCIGLGIEPCMDSPGGETTVGMINCHAAEQRRWQALIEAYLPQIRASQTSASASALDGYLTAHEAWRDARCQFAAALYEGGSLARVAASACMRDATADLAIDLFERLHAD